jgi:ABC-type oligopeptide transport system substrate-binding subunit
MKKRWLWPAAVVAALALGAAGCGGGNDENQGAQGGQGGQAAEQVITVNWGAEPPSLDPGLATDTTSSNILLNIMDPLVKLDDNLNAVPNAAESWDVSKDGTKVTLHLRDDLKWTNGDPVTASDYVYSWKRTISPELGADYAYQFFGIKGAEEYNSCDPKKDDCAALADKVGVTAPDDKTLEITLTSPQPWFIQQMSHHSFLAVNQKDVEQFGDKWTEAANIVTNGPFKLARWEHDSRIDLVKWDQWRDAKDVSLTRVNGRMITDGTTAVQAFEAGEVDSLAGSGLPPAEMPRLKQLDTYEQYPALGTYYYGINIKNITDPNQRRAMAMAIDRQTIIDSIAQADQLPATGYVPKGMPGFDTLTPNSQWLPPSGDIDQAKQLMSKVQNPKTDINLLLNDAPGHKEIAVAVQDMWKDLGLDVTIKQQEWAQFLEFLGPPPDKSVDVYRLGWIGDYPDAINFLDQWTCDSGNNNSNFCNKQYDELVNKVKTTNMDEQQRFDTYKQLEDILFGQNGEMPIIPIYWYTYANLEALSIKDTFKINPLDQVDLTQVKVQS